MLILYLAASWNVIKQNGSKQKSFTVKMTERQQFTDEKKKIKVKFKSPLKYVVAEFSRLCFAFDAFD